MPHFLVYKSSRDTEDRIVQAGTRDAVGLLYIIAL